MQNIFIVPTIQHGCRTKPQIEDMTHYRSYAEQRVSSNLFGWAIP